jgi:hypothetical protein
MSGIGNHLTPKDTIIGGKNYSSCFFTGSHHLFFQQLKTTNEVRFSRSSGEEISNN